MRGDHHRVKATKLEAMADDPRYQHLRSEYQALAKVYRQLGEQVDNDPFTTARFDAPQGQQQQQPQGKSKQVPPKQTKPLKDK